MFNTSRQCVKVKIYFFADGGAATPAWTAIDAREFFCKVFLTVFVWQKLNYRNKRLNHSLDCCLRLICSDLIYFNASPAGIDRFFEASSISTASISVLE